MTNECLLHGFVGFFEATATIQRSSTDGLITHYALWTNEDKMFEPRSLWLR